MRVQRVNHDGMSVCSVMTLAQVRMIGRKVGVVMLQFRRVMGGPKPQNGNHCNDADSRQPKCCLR